MRNFSPSWSTRKVVDTFQTSSSKNSLFSVSTKTFFQPSKGLIQLVSRSIIQCKNPMECEKENVFELAGL